MEFETRADGGTPGIDIADVVLAYGPERLFERFTLQLQAGRLTALLGRSGTGKSTLLKALAGVHQPHAGRISCDRGRPLVGRIAYMEQRPLLLPWLTVRANVAIGARLRGEPADLVRADRLLSAVGLSGAADQRPATLSGGMRQRVALARMLFEGRPVMLLDEPFSALDTLTRLDLYRLFALALDRRTVLLVTHDPAEAFALADDVVVLAGAPAGIAATLTLPAGAKPRSTGEPAYDRFQTDVLQALG